LLIWNPAHIFLFMNNTIFKPAGCFYRFTLLISLVFIANCSRDNEMETYTTIDQEILQLVNQHRKSMGKIDLIMNQTIWDEAMQHSGNMANGTVAFSHDGFSDRINRIKTAIGGSAAAENVAYGYPTAQSVVDGWLSSPGHKANMEGDFTLTGVSAVQNSTGTLYYTQIFLKK
jgi:uncharacterized protein YkwD